ncbi:MAG: hypothetical protein IT198_12235 [Acidimicrobiia bacterium]|nr:hypothetical protein [Acidimicrobiia bacterium]
MLGVVLAVLFAPIYPIDAARGAPGPAGAQKSGYVVEGDMVIPILPQTSQSRAQAAAAANFPGGYLPYWTNITYRRTYTIRLIASPYNVEAIRPALQAAAANASASSKVEITVASGQIPVRAPGTGEIVARVSPTSPCTSTNWAGCGGPKTPATWTNGGTSFIHSAGEIWIHPTALGYSARNLEHVVTHEIGHALALQHYNSLFNGENQVMHESSYDAPSFRSGDANGLMTIATTGRFFPYGPAWVGGAFVAAGDVDADGATEIVTGADAGGGSHVRWLSKTGADEGGFFAYPGFSGGVRVAVGNVDGTGAAEIITAPGPGGGPHVKIYRGSTLVESYMAYPVNFPGGVYVAACDITGDGKAEVITGAGPGGGPHVVARSLGGQIVSSFFAYTVGFAGGVRVACGDVNNDGKGEIITAPGPGGGPHVRVFRADGSVVSEFFAYAVGFAGGVYVGTLRLSNGTTAILTGAGESGGPHVRVLTATGSSISEFFPEESPGVRGVRLAGANLQVGGDDEIVFVGGPTSWTVVDAVSRTNGSQVAGTL